MSLRVATCRVVSTATALSVALAASLAARTARTDPEDLKRRVADFRVPFVENRGQSDPAVAYSARTSAGAVSVTRNGEILYSLARTSGTLAETPVGGKARPTGGALAPTLVNYFIGNDPARWRTGVPGYDSVELGNVWADVSVSVRARGRTVEKLFTLEPAARASRIRMRFSGARSLRIDSTGALVVDAGSHRLLFTAPVAYQEYDDVRRAVPVHYWARGRDYGFAVGRYDHDLPLVIDPLLQATYLGGFDPDQCFALAVHPGTGDVYAAGRTYSADFPTTAGGAQPSHGTVTGGVDSYQDGFIARFDPTLRTLKQATYLGGNDYDVVYEVAIHPTSGDVFVTGWTGSSNFPGTLGGAQTGKSLGSDAFVARLNADLTALIGATYLGGSGDDYGFAIAIDAPRGRVLVAGQSSSSDFPAATGGAQAVPRGMTEGFVALLNTTLTSIAQSTYFGSSGQDVADALAVQASTGDVFVAGYSNSVDLPGTAGGAQPSSGGDYDAFVARLDGSLANLAHATYLGGSGQDVVEALALHPTTGEVYVAGNSLSPNLPGTSGAAQPAPKGRADGFVTRLDPSLRTIGRSTYLGGGVGDYIAALAIHPATGDVFVAGGTDSADFPATAGGAQPFIAGASDAFVARLTAGLDSIRQATYLGGSDIDTGEAIAIHPATGEVYVAGTTFSANFIGTGGGAQEHLHGLLPGSADSFVARLSPDLSQGACSPGPTTLCVNDGRFSVEVAWRAVNLGASGSGRAATLTSDTGYFWFFTANNVELVVKVVDGRSFNGYFWVFYGALSDVEYTITVVDRATGRTKTYFNPHGRLASVADTAAFAAAGSASPQAAASVPSPAAADGPAICSSDPTSLCLNANRFRVRVAWQAPNIGASGVGQARVLTSDTGYFWFFTSNNVELVVKVVDGRAFNAKFWVFYGALSDVEYTITVTDTDTGTERTYFNPRGQLASVADTSAF